jgi:hypothetical protein
MITRYGKFKKDCNASSLERLNGLRVVDAATQKEVFRKITEAVTDVIDDLSITEILAMADEKHEMLNTSVRTSASYYSSLPSALSIMKQLLLGWLVEEIYESYENSF